MNTLQRRMVQRLGGVKAGTTMCPGRLARDCGTTLRAARNDMLDLARSGKIAFSQGGKAVGAERLKGPFRVHLRD